MENRDGSCAAAWPLLVRELGEDTIGLEVVEVPRVVEPAGICLRAKAWVRGVSKQK